jgi:glycolate oxidase FAD binding subunit
MSSQEPATTQQDGWSVFVGFEDSRVAVAWQIQQLEQEVRELDGQLIPHDKALIGPVWENLIAFPLGGGGPVTFKANLLPTAVDSFCQLAELHAPQLLAHAGNGVVIGHLSPEVGFEQAKGTIQRLREQAFAAQGNLVLLRCPPAWKAELGVWGRPRGDWELMRAVKELLDPKRLFNPGRFVGGI